jgi:hypothetical protein
MPGDGGRHLSIASLEHGLRRSPSLPPTYEAVERHSQRSKQERADEPPGPPGRAPTVLQVDRPKTESERSEDHASAQDRGDQYIPHGQDYRPERYRPEATARPAATTIGTY